MPIDESLKSTLVTIFYILLIIILICALLFIPYKEICTIEVRCNSINNTPTECNTQGECKNFNLYSNYLYKIQREEEIN